MSASCGGAAVVGADVRELAEALAALFAADRQLVVDLNAAQRRLLDANDLLRLGVSADALRALPGATGSGKASVLWSAASERGSLEGESLGSALEAIAESICIAFCDYQSAVDERRLLAADVGEATVRLVEAMTAAGFSEEQARNADVWVLRDGIYRQGGGG
ncbi:MAG: hypothetical protein ACR2H2_20160 [Solirubrobacteraceae bacterium]